MLAKKISIYFCASLATTMHFTVFESFAQSPNQQKQDIQIQISPKSAEKGKGDTGKTPPPVFSIEVPGPSKTSGDQSQSKSEDPGSRERAANQFFKDKQKQTISAKPKVKEASMRLSGSLCPACLKALAARFQKTEGVINASVELPSQMKASETETSNAIGKLPRYAVAHVTFDSNVLTIDRIKDIVRTNDLAFWKVEVTDRR
jgi:copper chaperone CopZ